MTIARSQTTGQASQPRSQRMPLLRLALRALMSSALLHLMLAVAGCGQLTGLPSAEDQLATLPRQPATLPPASPPADQPPPSPPLPVLTGTSLPLILAVLSPENAGRLALLAHWSSRSEVSQVAYSLDSRVLAVGTYAGIDLLDAQTGANVGSLPAPAWSLAFSPDGAVLASGWQGGLLQLWPVIQTASVEEGAAEGGPGGARVPLQALAGHTAAVTGLAWSPDGQYLASASDDGTVRLWDIAGCPGRGSVGAAAKTETCGRARFALEVPGSAAVGVAFGPAGVLVASGSWDGTVRVWEAGSGTPLHQLSTGGVAVRSLGAGPARVEEGAPGEMILAAGLADGSVRLWHVGKTVRPLATLTGHYGDVRSVAFSPRGDLVASGGDLLDQNVQVWQLGERPAALLRAFHQVGGGVLNLAFRPDGEVLVATIGHPTSGVRLWGVVGD